MSGTRPVKRTPRPYVKVDTSIGEHRKFLEIDEGLYLGCVGLFVLGLCHSDRLRTDGLVSERVLRRISPDYQPLRDELVRAGLWEESDDGYRPPNYSRWQDTADEIAAKSEQGRNAVAQRVDRQARPTEDATDGSTVCRTECPTPNPTYPTPPILPNLDEPPEPPEVRLHRESRDQLAVVDAGDLIRDFGDKAVSQAVGTTLENQVQGKSIKSWNSYVRGVCQKQVLNPQGTRVLPEEDWSR